ncbi:MAG: hypothetical protein ABSA57_05975 [Candidatus Acidiferrales bacterium]|jgi:hypothetical protein
MEPFAGTAVQFLTVVGPSLKYYEELIGEFTDAQTIRAVDTQDNLHKLWSALHGKGLRCSFTTLLPDFAPRTAQTRPAVFTGRSEKELAAA